MVWLEELVVSVHDFYVHTTRTEVNSRSRHRGGAHTVCAQNVAAVPASDADNRTSFHSQSRPAFISGDDTESDATSFPEQQRCSLM